MNITFSEDVAWPLSAPEKKVVECVRCYGKGYVMNIDRIEGVSQDDCWVCDGKGEHSEIK